VKRTPSRSWRAGTVDRQAEAAGLESWWCGEHVVLPDPRVPPSPMEPTDSILDPVIALIFGMRVTPPAATAVDPVLAQQVGETLVGRI
jgi:hypothetical protein